MTAAGPDAGTPPPCGGVPARTPPPVTPASPPEGTQRAAAGQAPAAAHPGSAVTPPAEPGTPASPPSHPTGPLPGTEGTRTSPQLPVSSRQAATGREPPPEAGTGPGAATDPAGGALDADDAPSAGTSGEQFRRQWKTARAGRNYGRRRARFKRAAAQPGPGMIRRPLLRFKRGQAEIEPLKNEEGTLPWWSARHMLAQADDEAADDE